MNCGSDATKLTCAGMTYSGARAGGRGAMGVLAVKVCSSLRPAALQIAHRATHTPSNQLRRTRPDLLCPLDVETCQCANSDRSLTVRKKWSPSAVHVGAAAGPLLRNVRHAISAGLSGGRRQASQTSGWCGSPQQIETGCAGAL